MRLGLIPKLLISVLLVLVVMASGLVAAVHSTFEADLSAYLLRVEKEQLEPLARRLGEEYERHGSWDFLRPGRRHVWPALVSHALGDAAGGTDTPALSPDAIAMMPRLSLIDDRGYTLIRTPLPPRPGSAPSWVSLPVNASGRQVGTLRMLPTPVPVKGLDQQFRSDQLHAFYIALVPTLLVTLLIAVPLGYHFARPLQHLARQLHALANGDYTARLPIGRRDELGRLAEDFNHLATVLEKAEAQRREGMASVSHELRTPLATMIAEVEAMQDGIRPLDIEQLRLLSGSMEHLEHLVDDLYQLALADVGAFACRKERLALDEVIEHTLDSVQARLEGAGLNLVRNVAPGVVVLGDPARLRQVVINLVENCIRYTGEVGEVTVTLGQEGDRAVLTVADDGPGIEPATMDRLFDRFYRAEHSRSRRHGGAGLGLSLVKVIAEAHGGTARAYRAPQGGLGIRFEIAVATPALAEAGA